MTMFMKCYRLRERLTQNPKLVEQRVRLWMRRSQMRERATDNADFLRIGSWLDRFLIDKVQILQLQNDCRLHCVAICVDVDYARYAREVFRLFQRLDDVCACRLVCAC